MAREGALAPAEELSVLPRGWRWVRLRELIDEDRGICYGIVQPGRHDPSGVPMVNSRDVVGGRVSPRIEFRVSLELHNQYRRSTIRGGEVLLTLVGANFGQVALAPAHLAGFNCSRPVGILPVVESPAFVALCLRSPLARRYMDSWANTTAQPTLNLEDVASLPIPLPPKSQRDAITHILGTLDDKIELNRRMSETLEAMARALFKSWFVDFDPVRTKAEGRDPGLAKQLTDLFPAGLVGSELGGIPEGWKVGTLADSIEVLRDPVNPLESPATPFRHFSIPAFDEGQGPVDELGGAIRSQKWSVEPGVVLLSKLNPEIERVWLVDVKPAEAAVCSTEFLVLRPYPPYGSSFVYCFCRSPWFRQRLGSLVTGTSKSHQRAQATSVLASKIVLPTPAASTAFERLAGPLLQRALSGRRQARVVAALRDALLPKLLNGDVRVADAQRWTGSAAV